ncbi:MAG: T9SS type A sorting domain-containing protein [Candidatus Marinimicrobia bacterium]|nr:T9SS type A sorting domain-containing protein [Candidatus Neomarinimicrobiota bacterium]
MSDIGVSIGQRFESEAFVMFGINISENLELVKNFIAAFGITFPVLIDPDQAVIKDYVQRVSTSPFPLDYIIDQEGRVVYHNTEYDPKRMTEIITNLLNPIGVEEEVSSTPLSFRLSQNYPNPFNPVTTISYVLPTTSKVLLVIYNLLGEEIARLVDGIQPKGLHRITWDASGVSSGIYFYRIHAGEFIQTRKMLLLR